MTTGNKLSASLCAIAAVAACAVGAAENDAPWRFRHYRFKIDDCMGERIGVQLSEFRLLNGDKDVTPLRSGFSHGEGMDSSERSPIRQAVDGNLNTKWYSANGASGKDMSKCWLQIDYAEPQPVTAYDWATAEDRWLGEKPRDKRDPMAFRLLGSDDGQTWTELDARSIGEKKIKRNDWTGPYSPLRGESFTAHPMLTRDGRRMISRKNTAGETVYELVPTNRLPANLPPIREWKLYGLKSSHTDVGLHNSQYIQRHGSVRRIDEAARLIDADKRSDDDPAAYRFAMEHVWFWDNYHMDKGMDAAWRIVTNYMARGRMDVGVMCAGNHTHLYSETEIDRSTLTKRLLEQKWGIHTRTFFMSDNPGLSCSLIDPYVRAGVRYCFFAPNQWNPIRSTIWKMRKKMLTSHPDYNNPDLQGGGNRIAVSYELDLPMVFRWKAPGGKESLLVWCSTHYGRGYERLGLTSGVRPSFVAGAEARMPEFLRILESKYPYDVWLAGVYCDDEWPNTGFADFAAKWNKKWLWPQFRTVGRLDEPFEYLEEKFGDKIPTLTGEMTSGWLQHAVCAPELLADKLNIDRKLETAERLGTFAGTIDRGAVDRAWWYLLLYDEHCYGTSGYKGRKVFETWMQRRDWLDRAAATASNELNKAVAKLGLTPALFTNDNCHNCSQITNINSSLSTRSTCSTRLNDSRGAKDGVTENRWYRVAVTNGVIYSIYDKELKRELIDGPANRFMYTRNNHKTWEAEPEKALGAKVTRRVYLAENEKRIDIEDRFEHARDLFNTRRYYRFGYLAFPFAVPGGEFRAHLNGTVIRPYEDCHPMTTDAYCAVRDWCLVENADFGVALMMRDSTLTEFGEIHPDKTCYTGKPPKGKTAIYSYLFTDWLQMHQPDGDSMNFTFRFAITSYANGGRGATALPGGRYCGGRGATALPGGTNEKVGRSPRDRRTQQWAHVARMCEDWLDPYAKWMRENNIPRFSRESVEEPPPGWTGLIEKPRAGHGEKDGQMYILWGAEMSPNFDHYELWRDGQFLANVTNEVHNGLPYRVARYEDLGLPTHSRHAYRIRKVWKDGRKDPLGEPFYGLTRYVHDATRDGVTCDGEEGRMDVRYDGATVTGDAAYESALGFHPYFTVADACNVAVDGKELLRPWVMQEFAADGKPHRLVDLKRKRSITVEASDNDTWYVWNPGTERTPLCVSLRPHEWHRFYCLEPVMKKSLPLAPGKSRTHRFKVTVGK